ncbi:MAG: hypothetical protein JJU11_15600 [Candidatus Sumerlaeia bacterium]|nr:hypothetical protein [Candidatus Sumerlaeia bacterium]
MRLAPNSATPSGAAIWLEYDAAVLTFIGGETNTDAFDDESLTIDPEAAGGNKVQFFAFSSSPLSGEDVLVGTLTFAANAEGSSNLEFLVEPGEETLVMNALLDDIEATLTGGSITVSPTSPTPTPTPIPVEADLFIIF